MAIRDNLNIHLVKIDILRLKFLQNQRNENKGETLLKVFLKVLKQVRSDSQGLCVICNHDIYFMVMS